MKTTWEIIYSEFPQGQVINICASKTIYNSCEQTYVSGYTLHVDGNYEQQEDYGSSDSFKKQNL